MENYKEERKFWLGELKKMGMKAPATLYPITDNDRRKEDQIEDMKMHMMELAQMRNYQQQYAEARRLAERE